VRGIEPGYLDAAELVRNVELVTIDANGVCELVTIAGSNRTEYVNVVVARERMWNGHHVILIVVHGGIFRRREGGVIRGVVQDRVEKRSGGRVDADRVPVGCGDHHVRGREDEETQRVLGHLGDKGNHVNRVGLPVDAEWGAPDFKYFHAVEWRYENAIDDDYASVQWRDGHTGELR